MSSLTNDTKPGLIQRGNEGFAKLADFSYRFKWLVFTVSIMILAGSVYLAQQVRIDNSFEAFFDSEDPAYIAYNTYRKNFGSDEIVYLMYDATAYEHGVFNLEVMKQVMTLVERFENDLPFVSKVRSLSNAELMEGDSGDLVIRKIEEEELSQELLLEFSQAFSGKDIYDNSLLNTDQTLAAIMIEMSRSSTDAVEEIMLDPEQGISLNNLYPQVSDDALRAILAEQESSDIKFYISGDVPLNSAYNKLVEEEGMLLALISLFLIAIVLGFCFHWRVLGILGPVVVVFLSILMCVAFLVIMGWNQDMTFGLAPVLLTAIGVAHSVHILSEFYQGQSEGLPVGEVLKNTFRLVGVPCLLSSLTTAAGFLSMSVAPIVSIAHSAFYLSLGVMIAFFLSMTLLSFFLSFSKPRKTPEPGLGERALTVVLAKTADFTLRHEKKNMLVFAVLLVLSACGISILKVDSNFLSDFSNKLEIRQHTAHIDNTMGGMNSFVYLFDSESEGGIKNPEFLKELERVQKEVETHFPLVRKTTSIVDLIKDINQSFHDGDPEYYRIPESKELISQYLLVYEFSGGEDLFDYVTNDYQMATINIRLQIQDSSYIEDFENEMQAYLESNPLEHSVKSNTGISALWLTLTSYISSSQLTGLSLALVVITLLISLIYGSLKMGLISMIPNVGPIILVVGFMGWMGIHLDYSKLLIATVAIGLAVDDTIHMMTRFKIEFERLGNYREAFKAAINEVGRALVITTLAMVIGWSALMMSSLDTQFWFAILLSMTVVFALLADFFVMPILIFWFKPFGPERARAQTPTQT